MIEFESGYVLPGGDQPLKHARVLHKGVQRLVKTVTASSEVTDYPGTAADNGTTVDRWKPFSNDVSAPSNFNDDDWTLTRFIADGDGLTLDEGADAATTRSAAISQTYTAEEWVVALRVVRQTMDGLQVRCYDGTTDFIADFDLRDGTVDSVNAGTAADVVSLGGNDFLLRMYFTPAAGSGDIQIYGWDGADVVTYTGTNRTVKIDEVIAHTSEATLRYDLFTAQSCDLMAIAAHNLFSAGGRVQFQHDSNDDDTWATVVTATPTDDSPIFAFLVPVTSSRWRIVVDRAVLPEVAVFRVGEALQMQRPFYAGFTPSRMSRMTETLGNISGSGELLGRSKKRSILEAEYNWDNLTETWVRANLDGPNGFIQSAETEPFFAAWRPGETQDVDYFMRATLQAPRAKGTRDLHDFSLTGEVHAYE